jgi:3-methyladenine DNA glycosylase Tag
MKDVVEKIRCPWGSLDPDMIHYHDTERRVHVIDDKKYVEFSCNDQRIRRI